MKKIVIGLLILLLVLGIGSMAFAQENGSGFGYGKFNFGQMLPFMQQIHPDWSVEDLQEMYNACHGTNGAAPSNNFRGMSMMGF
ncbi:MAG: hypothetical protein KGZ96_13030 [Clostridia bacterium]|jgi:uncharacterized protein YxeA|nr:hypothetical protein [Clostridia bacterium]